MGVRLCLWPVVALVVAWSSSCQGHARLVEPPSRASAWRYGFDTPKDYNDNQGFCGGFTFQYEVMGGRCGICGDRWDDIPRQHEAGGIYATGTIVRSYEEGQVIDVQVEVTANHMGHFEFRICPNNNPAVAATQTCLNAHPLPLADGSGFYHYINSDVGIHPVSLKLPEGLTCTQCVFQWRYVAGNNWGICEDGTGRVGCGPQEEFRACADVSISATTRTSTPIPLSTDTNTETTTKTKTTPIHKSTTDVPLTTHHKTTTRHPTTTHIIPEPQRCHAVGVWQQVPGMDEWCENNCNHNPPYCPESHCTCSD